MAALLSDSDIQAQLSQLPDWSLDGKTITSVRTFKDFVTAIKFVNQLVEPAEAAGHHPDLQISYNRVAITLSTHDAGGLTQKDLAMAEVISNLDAA
ncbi:MAG: 4a-hydroxytetrahydrobiopterin dehydratase [Nodosilinea sp.]